MTCILPAFEIKNVFGFSTKETNYYIDVIKSLGHLIMEFSESGGFENASNL